MKMLSEPDFLAIAAACIGGLERTTALRMFRERAVEVELKLGTWAPVIDENHQFRGWTHETCGYFTRVIHDFCPRCGAKMEWNPLRVEKEPAYEHPTE